MTTIDTLPTKTASSVLQTMKDATEKVLALALERQAEGINEYIESRCDQLQMYINQFQKETETAGEKRLAELCSLIGLFSSRKLELCLLQSNLRLRNSNKENQ